MEQSQVYQRAMERGRVEGITLGEARGITQGREEGTRKGMIESALTILEARFPDADVNVLKRQLEAIDDLDRLKQLNLEASIAKSLHDFQQSLNGDRA